jgi:hypothetical protein
MADARNNMISLSKIKKGSGADPYVFWYSGSGFFYNQEKIVRKTIIPAVF